ncbi:hypothetical protein E4U43_008607, partial [Claviceps pusilla]
MGSTYLPPDMSQQLPLPGPSYPPQGSRASSSHQAFGHPVHGHQSHQSLQSLQNHQIHQIHQQAQQQPHHHLRQRHPTQHPETHGSHIANPPPSTHPHSLAQHGRPHAAPSHGSLQHHLPSPQMPPPPYHVSRQDDARQNPPCPPAPSMSVKPAGNQKLMVSPFSKIDEATGRKY